MLDAYGTPAAVAMVGCTFVVTISYITEDSAEETTAVEGVPRWKPGYHRLVVAAELAEAITRGDVTLSGGWLRFVAPASLSMTVTVVFGGRWYDVLVTSALAWSSIGHSNASTAPDPSAFSARGERAARSFTGVTDHHATTRPPETSASEIVDAAVELMVPANFTGVTTVAVAGRAGPPT